MSSIWNLTRRLRISKTAKLRDDRTDDSVDPRSVPFRTVSANGDARWKSLYSANSRVQTAALNPGTMQQQSKRHYKVNKAEQRKWTARMQEQLIRLRTA